MGLSTDTPIFVFFEQKGLFRPTLLSKTQVEVSSVPTCCRKCNRTELPFSTIRILFVQTSLDCYLHWWFSIITVVLYKRSFSQTVSCQDLIKKYETFYSSSNLRRRIGMFLHPGKLWSHCCYPRSKFDYRY